jgi:hypothetical protein
MPQPARSGSFSVEEFFRRHGIRFRGPSSHDGGRKFVLDECPWDTSHRAPDAAVFEGPDGRLGFKCFHNSCQGRGWREFRDFYDPTERNLQAMPQMEDPDAARWGETAQWWPRADIPSYSRKYLEEQIRGTENQKKWQWVDSYPYTRDDGTPVLVKARFLDRANDKTFRQFLMTENGGWKPKRSGQARDLLYRRQSLASASKIFLVNGEKAADSRARQLGLCTTCYIEGEGEWHTGVNEAFRDKDVGAWRSRKLVGP